MIPRQPPDIPAENRESAVQLGRVLKRLHMHLSSKVMHGMQAELTELDLSFSQITALHHLRACGASSVTSLSESTHLSLPAASHLVERLVQRGLAQREENPENRREKVVSLTEAGQQVLNGMDLGFVSAYVTTFAHFPPETLQAATQSLIALLEQLDNPAGACPFTPPPKEPL